ncbi:PREDICTED: P-selectin glycoprotein ligand 1 [Galeopterus variegatus]|uniref:P-selectin glycoprotein ligand 1 n=1 Tax=Galeopterus variegatus TaxID=482537 RepID=A0ABM0QI27_GALVR|nr:PREDICTED: P-selectin glycoprotein ligand 1 [Galeopterus variegatus]
MPLQLLLLLILVGHGSSFQLQDTWEDGAKEAPGPLLARDRRQVAMDEDWDEDYDQSTDPPEMLENYTLVEMGNLGQRGSAGPGTPEPVSVEAATRDSAAPNTGGAATGNLSTELAAQWIPVTLDPLVTELVAVIIPITKAPSNQGALSIELTTTDALSMGPAATETQTTQPAATDALSMGPVATEAQTTQPAATEAQTTQPAAMEAPSMGPVATEAQTSQPAATEAQTTQPAAMEAPSMGPVATEAQTSQPAATEAQTTQPAAMEAQTTQPAATDALSMGPVATEAQTTQPAATEAQTTQPAATEAQTTQPAATQALSMEPTSMRDLATTFLVPSVTHKGTTVAPSTFSVASSPTEALDCIPVKQCLLAILILALVATVFLVCTVVLAVRLSRKTHMYPVRNYSPTEMVCISSLLPDRGDGPPTMANGTLPKAKSQGLMAEPSEDHDGDDLTLHSFLP